jgi:UDP-glucose 4-epimerase
VDIRNAEALGKVFERVSGALYAVVHFAALKAVGESAKKPLEYYENNISGALTLFRCMSDAKCMPAASKACQQLVKHIRS